MITNKNSDPARYFTDHAMCRSQNVVRRNERSATERRGSSGVSQSNMERDGVRTDDGSADDSVADVSVGNVVQIEDDISIGVGNDGWDEKEEEEVFFFVLACIGRRKLISSATGPLVRKRRQFLSGFFSFILSIPYHIPFILGKSPP